MSFRDTPTQDEPGDILGTNHHVIRDGDYTTYQVEVRNSDMQESNANLNNLVNTLYKRIDPSILDTPKETPNPD